MRLFLNLYTVRRVNRSEHQDQARGSRVREQIIISFSIFVISCLLDIPIYIYNCTGAGTQKATPSPESLGTRSGVEDC